jgi:crotonobetainyl-CoA:carnitine CoA-transferase CaiB-like acyl-CoA transferase
MFVTGNPVKLGAGEQPITRPPAKGEHNREIYAELLGYDEERITELAAAKVI